MAVAWLCRLTAAGTATHDIQSIRVSVASQHKPFSHSHSHRILSFSFSYFLNISFTMDHVVRVSETLKSFRETRLSALRPPSEFFDWHRISKPADLNQATSRISYNTRYFSGNYGLIFAAIAVYALLTSPLLLIAIAFLVGGFSAINKFAPEPLQMGEHVVTQKSLYTILFVIGIPLLWWASPLGVVFWIVGASSILIIGHACILEPGVESEYATVQDSV